VTSAPSEAKAWQARPISKKMPNTISPDTCIIRDTAARKGRTISVAPGSAAVRHLRYGRVILDSGDSPLHVDTGELETGFICLRGSAAIDVESGTHTLGRLDALYVPRDSSIEIRAGADGCDLIEVGAPVTKRHPVQFVAPGASVNFVWLMAAHREEVDRQFGVVNVQPEFAGGGSGIEKGRADRR
jgi:5-deoxy-D-glucuronate isomerase